MKSALVAVLGVLAIAVPWRVMASQSNQRVPVAPSQGGAEGFRLGGGGVPSGYMILGETQTAPPGYTFSGLSVAATGLSSDTYLYELARQLVLRVRICG